MGFIEADAETESGVQGDYRESIPVKGLIRNRFGQREKANSDAGLTRPWSPHLGALEQVFSVRVEQEGRSFTCTLLSHWIGWSWKDKEALCC